MNKKTTPRCYSNLAAERLNLCVKANSILQTRRKRKQSYHEYSAKKNDRSAFIRIDRVKQLYSTIPGTQKS